MTPIAVVDPFHVQVTYDYEEVHAVSVGLLQTMEVNDVSVSIGTAAAGLVISRLLAPTPLTPTGETKFLSDLFDWVGAYFSEGKVN